MIDLKGIGECAHGARGGIEDKVDGRVVRADHDYARVFFELADWVVEDALRTGDHVLVLEGVLPSDFHASVQGESNEVADLVLDEVI